MILDKLKNTASILGQLKTPVKVALGFLVALILIPILLSIPTIRPVGLQNFNLPSENYPYLVEGLFYYFNGLSFME